MGVYSFGKRYVKKRFLLCIFTIFSIILAIIGILIPYVTGNFIDFLVYLKNKNELISYCIFYSAICILSIFINFVISRISLIIVKDSVFNLQMNITNSRENSYILNIKYNSSAELSQKMNYDSNVVFNFFVSSLQGIISNVIMLIFPAIFLIKADYKIGVFLIALSVMYFVIYNLFKKHITIANKMVREQEAIYFGELNNRFINLAFIKNNVISNFFDLRLEKIFKNVYKFSLNLQAVNYLFFSMDKIVVMIAQILLFAYGGIQVLDGKITVGEFTIISTYFTMIISSIRYFFGYGKEYQEVDVSKNRILKILTTPNEEYGKKECNKVEKIKLLNFDFGYESNEKIFEDFSYEFLKGNIYVLRGNNGSGKTTLLKIISSLYYNNEDTSIFINDFPLKEYDLKKIRKNNFGVLEQKPVFVDGSIKENLFLDEINKELFKELVKLLNMNLLMEKLENNIDKVVKENDIKFSEGEKQKIALLRVLLKNSDVLILDEPTSAIDDLTKKNFIEYIKVIKNDKIIIITTHDEVIKSVADYELEI